jgi:hypothetical protein
MEVGLVTLGDWRLRSCPRCQPGRSRSRPAGWAPAREGCRPGGLKTAGASGDLAITPTSLDTHVGLEDGVGRHGKEAAQPGRDGAEPEQATGTPAQRGMMPAG